MTTEIFNSDSTIPLLDEDVYNALPRSVQLNLTIHKTLQDISLKILDFIIGTPDSTHFDETDPFTSYTTKKTKLKNANHILELFYGDQSSKDKESQRLFLLIKLFNKLVLQFLNKPDVSPFEDSGSSPKLKYFVSFNDFVPGILNTKANEDLMLLTNPLSFHDFVQYMTHNDSLNSNMKKTSHSKELLEMEELSNSSVISLPLQYEILASIQKINLCIYLLSALGLFPYNLQFIDMFFLDILGGNNEPISTNSISNYIDSNDFSSYDKYNLIFQSILVGPLAKSLSHSSSRSVINYTFNPFYVVYLKKLLRQHVVLLLELKTQVYIGAIEHDVSLLPDSQKNKPIPTDLIETKLNDIFDIKTLEASLLKRKQLYDNQPVEITPIEQEFLSRCLNRRQHLQKIDDINVLSRTYHWNDFLVDFIKFLQKRFDNNHKKLPYEDIGDDNTNSISSSVPNSIASTPMSYQYIESTPRTHQTDQPITAPGSSLATPANDTLLDCSGAGGNNSSAAKKPASSNKSIKPKQKNPWTSDEEDALLKALKVCGPQWSNILSLFGAGGRISENLKNRTQVQLKDKSRNWKMFFLKTDIPVPPYLETVTGGIERSTTGGNKTKIFKKKTKPIKKTTIRMDLNKFKYNDDDQKIRQEMESKLKVKSFITENEIDTDAFNNLLDINNPLNKI